MVSLVIYVCYFTFNDFVFNFYFDNIFIAIPFKGFSRKMILGSAKLKRKQYFFLTHFWIILPTLQCQLHCITSPLLPCHKSSVVTFSLNLIYLFFILKFEYLFKILGVHLHPCTSSYATDVVCQNVQHIIK